VTNVRTVASVFGAALTLAAAGIMSAQAISSAQPETHTVRYTVTTQVQANFDLYYLVKEPADQAAVDANSKEYLRNERVTIAPGVPWVFETTLNDTQWAIVTAGSAFRVPPNPSCEIAIDGQTVVAQSGVSGAQCALRTW